MGHLSFWNRLPKSIPETSQLGNSLELFRQEKGAQRLSFWVRRPPGGVGVFHAKGWWPKTSCPPSKLCFPWVSKRGIRDVPGILPGCPGPLAVFKKFVQKKLRAHFSFPNYSCLNRRDVNFFGTLFLPSEVHPCQARRTKALNRNTISTKNTFSEKFGFKISQ